MFNYLVLLLHVPSYGTLVQNQFIVLENLLINVSLNIMTKNTTVTNKSSLYMQIFQVLYLLSSDGFQVNAI
jgi:hypothetical protein